MGGFPKHIGIIMDGNGRWAKARGLPRIEGHRRGVKVAREIVSYCSDLGINYLTLYAFSLENWQRPTLEVSLLMRLLRSYAVHERPFLMEHQMRLNVIGDQSALPKEARFELQKTMDLTQENKGLVLQLALSYGGRDDILRATKKIGKALQERSLDIEKLDEEKFSRFLDTSDQPDPDLIIRSSGEQRTSNFLTWQAAYSELYFSKLNWPDFDRDELDRALDSFRHRSRRFGGLDAAQTPQSETGK